MSDLLDENVIKATQMSPTDGSLSIILGPYGVGKSWMAGTMAEYLDPEEILVIGTEPREVKSTKYQEHDLDTIIVVDEDWAPEQKRLNAGGYDTMMDLLSELRDDTQYGGIIIDNGTELCEMAWHTVLANMGIINLDELRKKGVGLSAYGNVREKNEQLFYNIGYLTGQGEDAEGNLYTTQVARPKLIAIPWHVQPQKEKVDEGDSADEKAEDTEYKGKKLPMIRGAFRRRLGGKADNMVFCDRIRQPGTNPLNPKFMYAAQVYPDDEHHTKLAGPMPDPSDLIDGKYIENDWSELMELLETGG